MSQLEKLLQDYFGYNAFRTGQKEIIEDVLAGNNVLGVLPTGSGKSICYQIPAIKGDNTVIVVSPLLSLMSDQVKQLKARGFKQVVAINSFVDHKERHFLFDQLDSYKLIYLSPEMLQNDRLLERLKRLKISLFVIDEAHCISQWGHEFRPDYLKLNPVIEALNNPPILALSATATPEVQKDIAKQLNNAHLNKHVYPMDRDNIAFTVQALQSKQEKVNYLKRLLGKFPVPTMIYFSSKKEAEFVASQLRDSLTELRIAFYHGGMEQVDRILIQQQFMENQLDVICCTSAFGMGIDKSNVRLVVHYHIPTQIESFIQEIGRAGRDGLSSVSLVLHAPYDDILPKRLIESELPTTEQIPIIINRLDSLARSEKSIDLGSPLLLEEFQINETQWRFLHYQLEKHDMIKENRILPIYDKKREIVDVITQRIIERTNYKINKLDEMLTWVTCESCRRERLYQAFQPNCSKAKYLCCDYCDFEFNKWEPIIESKQLIESSWEIELANLFFREGSK
ncbi:ATP-dependent DNA helicase RecQ [Paraliobacillus sp. X-1268]|uniref:RecQ family ATP-dependent DNA helicase n=1 Tax=Paraliobacillus sp. X-1268 TaxID=2213193 RepID=UPI000E3E283B|nr:ATP-dependent DNA helicase RecQ [Paraliobacillus sp. X-1268]